MQLEEEVATLRADNNLKQEQIIGFIKRIENLNRNINIHKEVKLIKLTSTLIRCYHVLNYLFTMV